MEHDIAAREVEKTTKQAIEATGRALLKEKREATPTSGILDIVDEIMNNLFIIEDNKDQSPPKTHLLPPYPHKRTQTRFLPHPPTTYSQAVVSNLQRQRGSTAMD
jgi:hypothetical protein